MSRHYYRRRRRDLCSFDMKRSELHVKARIRIFQINIGHLRRKQFLAEIS